MRILFSFILAIMLLLNSTYALSVAICDALENEPITQHLNHLGHHQHHTKTDEKSSDDKGKAHCHEHVHPNFTSIPSGKLHALSFGGTSRLCHAILAELISITQLPPERPPRAVLA